MSERENYNNSDVYDVYGCNYATTLGQDDNKIKTFSCNLCKQSKLVLKKSVSDPIFKCDECIEKNGLQQQQVSQQQDQETTSWKWFSFF